MAYDIETIRHLAEKYFLGETDLAEEAELRGYFSDSTDVPAELEPCRLLFGLCAEAADIGPRRELVLRNEVNRPSLRSLTATVSAVAAVILVAVFIAFNFQVRETTEFVCYVNGFRITDREIALEYTQEAYEMVVSKLQEPAQRLSQPENNRTIELVNELINTLTE